MYSDIPQNNSTPNTDELQITASNVPPAMPAPNFNSAPVAMVSSGKPPGPPNFPINTPQNNLHFSQPTTQMNAPQLPNFQGNSQPNFQGNSQPNFQGNTQPNFQGNTQPNFPVGSQQQHFPTNSQPSFPVNSQPTNTQFIQPQNAQFSQPQPHNNGTILPSSLPPPNMPPSANQARPRLW